MVASIHLPKYTFIITLMNISRVKVVRVGGKCNLGCRKTLFFWQMILSGLNSLKRGKLKHRSIYLIISGKMFSYRITEILKGCLGTRLEELVCRKFSEVPPY